MARTLDAYGIDHVFFVESTLRHTLNELEILGIKRVGARSEKGAAYMADGYARTRRGPAICMAQSVGAANMAAGLQDAYLGQSPVIALTGRKTPIFQYRNAYQEIDHMPMFEPVTKYNVTVDTTEQLPFLLRQAFREATTGAPGPAHLDMAGGWGGQFIEDGTGEFTLPDQSLFAHYPAVRPLPADDALRAALDLLQSAQRPVIIAAGGAVMSGAAAEVRELAERLRIPVATSLNGKNSIPENHPLSIGVVGSYSREATNRVVVEADLVFYIGSRTGDQVTNDWTVPGFGVPVIQLDIEPAELGRSYPNAVSIAGDARESLRRMLGLVDEAGAATARELHGPWADKARGLVDAWLDAVRAIADSPSSAVRVERLCAAITDGLPEDAILVSDTGSAGIWTGAYIPLTEPGQLYLRAAGSLGWGFPAALGAKCAAPDRPVVCFTGDGGFWYHLNEMETAVRCGINAVTIVNNNHGYGQCISAVEESYKGYTGGRPEEIYGITETNFAALAEEVGCMGIRVTDAADLDDALAEALQADRPVVIDVVTDTDSRAPSGWKP